MFVFYFGDAFFDVDHLVDELHGTGAVECEEVNDVFDFVDAVFFTGFNHSAGFQLEDSHGFTSVEDG